MKSKNITLTVNVADVNDVNPVFTQQIYEYNVTEDKVGYLTMVQATDSDGSAPNNQLVFDGIDPSNSGILTFDPSGNITINAGKLDRETANSHEFLLVVTDSSTDSKRQGSAILVLNVIDVNDNNPQFTITSSAVIVSEHIPVGSSVFRFSATDADITSTVTYHANDASDPDWSHFTLNETDGSVTTQATFDFTTNSFYQVEVVARDDGNRNSTIAYLNVTVLDVPVNTLVFDKNRYYYTREEGNAFIPVQPLDFTTPLKATAEDGSVVSTVMYYMVPDSQKNSENFFRVDGVTGSIFQTNALDYEASRYYTFEVVAVDTSGRYGNATSLVVVEVININDVPPTLVVNTTSVSIRENTDIGQVVAVFHVVDIDGGIPTYTFVNALGGGLAPPFLILPVNETNAYLIVSQHPLDREAQDFYMLDVTVEDPFQNKETVRINITITDANDNNPVFEVQVYSYTVNDNLAIGTSIGTVIAKDNDTTTENSQLAYSLYDPDGNNHFSIDELTGVISVAANLTVDQDKVYVYQVFATDRRSDTNDTTYQRKGSALVRFYMKRTANDPPLMELVSFTVTISEKFPKSGIIYSAHATDRENDLLAYSFSRNDTANPDNKYFKIGLASGDVTLSDNTPSLVDAEVKTVYVIYVRASELIVGKDSSNELKLTIMLTDVNDHSPKFVSDKYDFSVEEHSPTATVIGQVFAYDNDTTTANNKVYYMLGNDMYANLFAINVTTGEIHVNSKLFSFT